MPSEDVVAYARGERVREANLCTYRHLLTDYCKGDGEYHEHDYTSKRRMYRRSWTKTVV